jgi:hypothetical protein
MMNAIFVELPFVYVYLDDVLIVRWDQEEHRHHLRQVFKLLSKNRLLLNVSKCMIATHSIEFLGHFIIAGGFSPLFLSAQQ